MTRLPLRRLRTLGIAAGATAALVLGGQSASFAATGTGAWSGTVSTGGLLKVRADATSGATNVGTLRNRSRVTIVCQVHGQWVKGRVRGTDLWDRLGGGRYVSDAYVKHGSARILICPPPPPPVQPAPATGGAVAEPQATLPAPTSLWVRPIPAAVSGGFRTLQRPEHDGVDIGTPRNTPIHAAAAGTVVTVKCNTSGTTCDVDGSPSLTGCGWYVEVQHADSVITRYCHMVRQPEVVVGQRVTVGQLIGYSGTSGSSSGPHLHFEVHIGAAPARHDNAVDPVPFMATHGAPITSPSRL
jgi:murein DD-endopeptidase MepM/ murein hydrolase activator NlpD